MSAARSRLKLALLGFVLTCTTLVGMAASPTVADAGTGVFCRGWEATIVGTAAGETLMGTNGKDVIKGLGGDDIIYGLDGGDILCGDGGDDILYGEKGHDRLFGGIGDDTLYGGNGHDRLFGKGGFDTLYGGFWSDVCIGEDETNCEVNYRGERDEELWRDLVDEFFGDINQTNNALVIIACESNGDPFAVNPNGNVPKGLWQFIPSTWDWATEANGKWTKEHRFHPRAATETARWLYNWADNRTRQDGSDGQGFDPWTNCRCLLSEYDCEYVP